jgi:predicted ATP-grasp superfamily ATP-dependent carboligase
LVADVPTAASDILHGHLKLADYFQSLKRTRVESVFSSKDPLPSIAEFVLLPYFITKKFIV